MNKYLWKQRLMSLVEGEEMYYFVDLPGSLLLPRACGGQGGAGTLPGAHLPLCPRLYPPDASPPWHAVSVSFQLS